MRLRTSVQMPGIIQNMEEKVDRSQGAIDKELVGEEKPGKERVNARERHREREAGEVREDYTSETR